MSVTLLLCRIWEKRPQIRPVSMTYPPISLLRLAWVDSLITKPTSWVLNSWGVGFWLAIFETSPQRATALEPFRMWCKRGSIMRFLKVPANSNPQTIPFTPNWDIYLWDNDSTMMKFWRLPFSTQSGVKPIKSVSLLAMVCPRVQPVEVVKVNRFSTIAW